jgi:hypothetical protein
MSLSHARVSWRTSTAQRAWASSASNKNHDIGKSLVTKKEEIQ